ncbi:hypothetical protein ASPZODRAFT_17604 [Penicilliopsis zonata CBS 506.65]|uniref:inorganic diphosphatase n=1 Tax=Penicilliopsis zonata CBS 506.65 TaxID=1073090 RepID=A0A1L9SDW2_9EURO|nr:hypothetical protein ASPZODRAFT_17604 [Penicilliopsis zonata CBS 506.65]OJJ45386.1 hypothetical protein ASPZODRAFT_17604 [Penicilliopsis zonata CBS 506.65]
MAYSIHETGRPNSLEHRIYLSRGSSLLSPWHEVPLYTEQRGIVNMIVTVPRWTHQSMTIAKDEFLTPLRPDTHKGELRYVPNIFPHRGYPWTYGALPQTFEDPNVEDQISRLPGDNEPLDVIDLAGDGDVGHTGQVREVKVLGAIGVIGFSETDWKIVAIDTRSELAERMQEIEDVETHMPGFLGTIKEWFRVYPLAEGGCTNQDVFRGELELAKGKAFASMLIERSHQSWNKIETKTR